MAAINDPWRCSHLADHPGRHAAFDCADQFARQCAGLQAVVVLNDGQDEADSGLERTGSETPDENPGASIHGQLFHKPDDTDLLNPRRPNW